MQCLGAVYTSKFAYKSPHDSVYDMLLKVHKLIFDSFLLECVDYFNGPQMKNCIPIWLHANCAQHRTLNRTRVDGPLISEGKNYLDVFCSKEKVETTNRSIKET
jgi:hypothetical protein